MTNRQKPIELLTRAEVERLFRACGRGPAGMRDRALLALLYRAGLRVSEALALRPKDLDLDAGVVQVLRGKGGRQRVAAIDAGGAAVVARWMEARAGLGLTGRNPVICTVSRGAALRPGRALHRTYVNQVLSRLKDRAGLDKRVHPHGLRHTHAAELEAEGQRVREIQQQLGHQSLATTQSYLDHLSPSERVARLRDRPAWSA
jgi:site-specific recombinase XerD